MAHPSGKRKTHEVPSGDLIWSKLEAVLGPAPTVRPPNSITAGEFAHRRCLSMSRASAILRDLVEQGKMKRIGFRNAPGRMEYAYVMED